MERKELVERLALRDGPAWDRFIGDYGRMIYAVAGRLGLSESETEDHFQASCLAVFRGIASLRQPERLSTWTYRIAYRQGLDLIRRRRPQVSIEDPVAGTSSALRVEPRILEEIERLEEISRLLDALSGLDERCRNLLTALFLEDPPPAYAEISRREKIPMGSIGPTRARCLEKLENRLANLSEKGLAASDGTNEPPVAPAANGRKDKEPS